MSGNSAFMDALGDALGGKSVAEYCVRQARSFGLRRGRRRGRHKSWTVDDLAAITLMFLIHQIGGASRREAEENLRDPDPFWRDAMHESLAQALAFGWEIHFSVGRAVGGVHVTAVLDVDVGRKLAALVDDWGRLRHVWETREAA